MGPADIFCGAHTFWPWSSQPAVSLRLKWFWWHRAGDDRADDRHN